MQTEGILWLIFIIWNSICDLRKKEISLCSCLLFAAIALALCIVKKTQLHIIALSFVPGMLLLLVSFLSKGAIGLGDGLVLLVTGWLLGPERTIRILFYGLLLSAVAGGILVFAGRIERREEQPFVPYLFLGSLAAVVLYRLGGLV